MRIKIILFALVTILLAACGGATTSRSPHGVYSQKNHTHHFEINNDSTFKYQYRVDTFIDIVSEGTWKMKNPSTVLLSSYKEPILLPITFDRKKTPGSKRTRQLHIELTSDRGNESDFFVIPHTNRVVLPSSTRQRGSHMIETAFLIDSVYFTIYKEPERNSRPKPTVFHHKISAPPKYTTVKTEQLELKLHPGESAYIAINVKDEDFSYRTFKNTPLELTSNGVRFKDSDDNTTYNLDSH